MIWASRSTKPFRAQGGAVGGRRDRIHLRRERRRICRTITRVDFERWIAEDVARIGATVDEALARSGVAAADIDHVFLTGGTSFVPAIRHLFVDRFGEDRLTAAEQFESIAYGLALIGQDAGARALAVQG